MLPQLSVAQISMIPTATRKLGGQFFKSLSNNDSKNSSDKNNNKEEEHKSAGVATAVSNIGVPHLISAIDSKASRLSQPQILAGATGATADKKIPKGGPSSTHCPFHDSILQSQTKHHCKCIQSCHNLSQGMYLDPLPKGQGRKLSGSHLTLENDAVFVDIHFLSLFVLL